MSVVLREMPDLEPAECGAQVYGTLIRQLRPLEAGEGARPCACGQEHVAEPDGAVRWRGSVWRRACAERAVRLEAFRAVTAAEREACAVFLASRTLEDKPGEGLVIGWPGGGWTRLERLGLSAAAWAHIAPLLGHMVRCRTAASQTW